MSKEAMNLAQKWQQTDWNTESPMSADFAVSEANDVISALMDALREALAEQPAQRTWVRLTDDLKRAIESMIESHEVGDLDGWEVQLVKRRLHEATNGIKEQP